MNRDKKILYTLSALFAALLLLIAFVPNITLSKVALALLCTAVAVVSAVLIRKRFSLALPHREAALVVFVCALVALMAFYLSGLSFGFYTTPVLFPRYLYKYILPYTVIIVASEVVRRILMSQKNALITVLCYISLTTIDALMLAGLDVFSSYSNFMDFFGLSMLPAVTANLLYCYLSANYGFWSVAPYRTLMAIYPYLFSKAPATPDAIVAFAKLLLPLVVFVFIRALYEKRKFVVSRKHIILRRVGTAVMLVCMTILIMLISCQFRYGMLVVGSESMTGEINKGDATIYERYEGEYIEEGQVVVFVQNRTRIIHRVVDIQHINGETRYYTKGDANASADAGYITADQIIGTAKLKIKYIGLPTLWLRSLFK